MLNIRNTLLALGLIVILSLLSQAASAQPEAGDFWFQRALLYAQKYWDGVYSDKSMYNPDYGVALDENEEPADCAHFCSQIAQAGCAGLCEMNKNDNWGSPIGDCEFYISYAFTDSCHYCPTGYHDVLAKCTWLNMWFNANEDDWANRKLVYSSNDLPSWVGPGTFVIAFYEGFNHAVWVGHGPHSSDPNSWVGYCHYYAHTTDRGGASGTNTLAYLMGGPTFIKACLYGPGESPVTPPREEMETELTKTEQGGPMKK